MYRTLLFLFMLAILTHCQDNSQISENNTAMIYKLYIETSKIPVKESQGLALFPEFNTLYKQHDVKVIGVWTNTDNPYEVYFMTAFRDNAHYEAFVESMKGNEKYQEMSAKLGAERDNIKVINLEMSDTY